MRSALAQLGFYQWFRAFVIVIVSACLGFSPGAMVVLLAAEETESESATPQRMTPQEVVDALVSSREGLHSGEVEAHWKWTTSQYKENAEWHMYFDYDKGLSRVDRHIVNRGRRVIRIDTPVEAIHYMPSQQVGVISRLPPGTRAVQNGQVFDVRTTGLVQLGSFQRNDATWAKLLEMLKRDGRPALQIEADGIQRITWRKARVVGTPNGKLVERTGYSFWIDPTKNFVPVRATFFSGASPDPEVNATMLATIIEAEWGERSGIMVPLRCSWQLPPWKQSAELIFEWKSVNKPIAETLFTPEALGAPEGTIIVNKRLGQEFIEGKIGDPPPMPVRPQTSKRLHAD